MDSIYDRKGELVTDEFRKNNIQACRTVIQTPLHLDVDHLESPHATEEQLEQARSAGVEFTPYDFEA